MSRIASPIRWLFTLPPSPSPGRAILYLFAFVLDDNDYGHRPPPTIVFLYRGPADSLVRAARPMDDDEVFPEATEDGVYDCVPVTLAVSRR